MHDHDPDDWDLELARVMFGQGTGWVFVVLTAATIALLCWHFFG